MEFHNFCPECGEKLDQEHKNCPNCGESVVYDPVGPSKPINKDERITPSLIPQSVERKKPMIKKLGFFSWILLLIGSAVGFYALTTPAGSTRVGDLFSWDMWMIGYNRVFESGVGLDVFWVQNESYLFVCVLSTVLVFVGNIAAIITAGFFTKSSAHFSYAAFIAPIALIGSALFFLAGYEALMFIDFGDSFWGVMGTAFGIWGQFLAALCMVLGILIARGASKYVEPIKVEPIKKEMHQEKVFEMLKRVLEIKFLLPNEKELLNNEMNVISLRLKGVASLKRELESKPPRKSSEVLIEEMLQKEGLIYFQQAYETSPDSFKEISKIDLELARDILNQKDKNIALFYLNKISDNTTILIGKIFKKISH
ncbi:MAG: hypothetical protein ACW96S_12695 [Promethearchaeota archaeon]|jgi:hypothetical protein